MYLNHDLYKYHTADLDLSVTYWRVPRGVLHIVEKL